MTTPVDRAETSPDDPGRLLTLTEAATLTGYSREALRLRVRRKKLPAVRGNDRVVRIKASDLSDLPPVTLDDPEGDPPVMEEDEPAEARLQLAVIQVERDAERRRADAAEARLAIAEDDLRAARALADERALAVVEAREQVGRAEAGREAATAAQTRAENHVQDLMTELRELRRPWLERLARAIRGG